MEFSIECLTQPSGILAKAGHLSADVFEDRFHRVQLFNIQLTLPKRYINGIDIARQQTVRLALLNQTFLLLQPKHTNGRQISVPNFHRAAHRQRPQIGVPATIKIGVLDPRPLLGRALLFFDLARLSEFGSAQITANV